VYIKAAPAMSDVAPPDDVLESYYEQNLKPCMEEFLREVRRHSVTPSWSYCDIAFTPGAPTKTSQAS
jgi:hypothetical protein